MKMSPGEFGCFCSHRMIWKRIVEQKLDNVIILEDDAIFSKFFKLTLLVLNKKYLPHHFDLIDLRKKEGKKANLLLNSNIDFSWGTESYMVSFEGAKKLLEATNEVEEGVDFIIRDLVLDGRLRSFGMRLEISNGQEYGSEKINNTILRFEQ
jgi:glycosyl transferase family 25